MNDTATQTCPNCSRPNPMINQFCQFCGSRLVPGETPQAAPSAPTFANQSPSQQVFIQPQSTAPQPATAYPSSSQSTYYGTVQIDRLGQRLDGWADLIDGASERSTAVENAFVAELKERMMPQVNITRAELTPGGLAGKRRGYALVQSYTGATMGVYVGAFGKDLYVTWDLFVRPVILWRNILIMLGVAAVMALVPQLDDFSFIAWILGTIGAMIPVVIIALILGKALRNSALAFFLQEIDLFAADDITAMMFSTHHALLGALAGVGIDTAVLRKKETFYAGRRERVI